MVTKTKPKQISNIADCLCSNIVSWKQKVPEVRQTVAKMNLIRQIISTQLTSLFLVLFLDEFLFLFVSAYSDALNGSHLVVAFLQVVILYNCNINLSILAFWFFTIKIFIRFQNSINDLDTEFNRRWHYKKWIWRKSRHSGSWTSDVIVVIRHLQFHVIKTFLKLKNDAFNLKSA